jgi:hypothetical protein
MGVHRGGSLLVDLYRAGQFPRSSLQEMTLIHGHRICQCRRCIGHVVDMPGGPIKGRRVTRGEYSQHEKRGRFEEKCASNRYVTRRLSSMSLIGFSRTNRGSASRRNLNEISQLEKELEQRAHSFCAPTKLSFTFPPVKDSPEPPLEKSSDPNDLLEHRTLSLRNHSANLPVIEFEKWIATSIGRLSKFLSAKDSELRTAASDLHLKLELQAQVLRKLVRQEWYRQRELAVAQSSVAMLRKPVRSAEVDCCTFPSNFWYYNL